MYSNIDQPPSWVVEEAQQERDYETDEELLDRAREIANALYTAENT